MSDTIRVRFAPSPTGKLHIGGARTAIFNWAYARRRGGRFVLRVEDTDKERSKPEYEGPIYEGLRWLGLDWDEGPDVGGAHGPYRQSERGERYAEVARELREKGVAYRCFCSSERLTTLREEQQRAGENPGYDGRCRDLASDEQERRIAAGEQHVLRFRVPPGEVHFDDMVRGSVTFHNQDVDDWIMLRADGSPTYNFCVVVDDSDMRIDHVLRGDDHLTNTPKQLLLYAALGLTPPRYAHFPLMLGKDKKKMSKRMGHTAVQDYQDEGYPAEATFNFLSLQGWGFDETTEIFSAEEMVEHFDVGDVGKRGAIFDPEKFLWMAGEYIRMDTLERVAERTAPFVVAAGLMSAEEIEARKEWFLAVVATAKERIRTYGELPAQIAYLFAADDAVEFQEKALKNVRKQADFAETLEAYLAELRPRLEGGVDAPVLRDAAREWVGERGLKFPALFQPLRCVLTGQPGGPDLFDVMSLLGPERTLRRIETGLQRLVAAC